MAVYATSDPTVNDDSTKGYGLGDLWINTAAAPRKVFELLNPAAGAAVWGRLLHMDVAGEIITVPLKATPSSNDVVLMENSAASNAKVRATVQSIADLASGGAPSGPAGGDLDGNYPNPTVKQSSTAFGLTGVITPASLGSSQNDYNPAGLSTVTTIRQASSVNVNITGLDGGAAGRVIVLQNIGAFSITLVSESLSSAAANRFLVDTEVIMPPNSSVFLRYDGTSLRWRSIGSTNNVSVGGGKSYFTPFASNSTTPIGTHATVSINSNGDANFEFACPNDFSVLINAYVIGIAQGTNAAADIDLTVNYFNPVAGEAFNTHTGSNLASTYNLTNNNGFALSLNSILGSLASGDLVGLFVEQNTVGFTNGYLGCLFIYS